MEPIAADSSDENSDQCEYRQTNRPLGGFELPTLASGSSGVWLTQKVLMTAHSLEHEPETQTPATAGGVEFKVERIDANLVDAATRGTTEGLGLALNVGAMLISFTALVALVNAILTSAFGYNPFVSWWNAHHALQLSKLHIPTLEQLLSYPMAPLAWLSGVSWHDARPVGSLLGIKTVLNELIAYSNMKDAFRHNPNFISPRSALIATYALCGFANFASIGIQVGGISTLAPNRRTDLSRLGLLAMIGGTISSFMTAAVVGVLL